MDVNKVTLECLVNPTLYNKYLRKFEKENKDVDFYKKRILDLTSKLFEEKSANAGLNESFNNYINECISYLYTNDMRNTFQEEYTDISFNDELTDIILDISNADTYIIKKKEDTKINKYVKKKNGKPKKKYPVKKEFNPKDIKFKEP